MKRLIDGIAEVLRNVGVAGIIMGMLATGFDTVLGFEFRFTHWEMLLIGLTSLSASYAIQIYWNIRS